MSDHTEREIGRLQNKVEALSTCLAVTEAEQTAMRRLLDVWQDGILSCAQLVALMCEILHVTPFENRTARHIELRPYRAQEDHHAGKQ